MLHKLPIRLRISLITAFLMGICCIGLTIILNYSAYQTVDSLQAELLTPSLPESATTPQVQENNKTAQPATLTTDTTQAKWSFRSDSIVYMIFVILGGSFFIYYMVGKALLPLSTLNTKIKEIKVHNLATTLDVPLTKDEIAELSISFNDMMGKLNEAFLIQQRFSASAAHELRTPLAILETKIDVFRKQPKHTREEYDLLVDSIHEQNMRLCNLVATLLDLTNMDTITEVTEVPLLEMMEDIIDELSALADKKKIKLHVQGDDSRIVGNIDLLYHAFYNLVENSIKYNVEGGHVTIHIYKTKEQHHEIRIHDSGIGIPDDQKKYIFDPFYRVDKSRSREMGGVGLGLSFVKHVIQKLGGNIEVMDAPTQGTCFHITLP